MGAYVPKNPIQLYVIGNLYQLNMFLCDILHTTPESTYAFLLLQTTFFLSIFFASYYCYRANLVLHDCIMVLPSILDTRSFANSHSTCVSFEVKFQDASIVRSNLLVITINELLSYFSCLIRTFVTFYSILNWSP